MLLYFDVVFYCFDYGSVGVVELSELSQSAEIFLVDFVQVLQLDELLLSGALVLDLVLEIVVLKVYLNYF